MLFECFLLFIKKRQKIAKSDKLYYNENAKNKIIKHNKKYNLNVVRGVV